MTVRESSTGGQKMTLNFPLFFSVRGVRTAGRPAAGPKTAVLKLGDILLAFNGDLPIRRSRGYDPLLAKRAALKLERRTSTDKL